MKLISKIKQSNNPIIRSSKKVAKFVINKQYRSLVYMRTIHSSRTQQTTQLTFLDRYPQEFQAAKEYFEKLGKSNIKILSFGCCTGEEVITLRHYFPDATIVGAEINKESLRICRQRKTDDKIHFIKSKPSLIKKYGPYDMVLAMAVLERTPHLVMDKGITDLSEIYPYSKYEKQVFELDSYLKEGGLFVSSFSHYYILDTPLQSNYEVYGNCGFIGLTFDTNSLLKNNRTLINDMFIKNGSYNK